MINLETEYLRLARTKTQSDLIKHLFDTNGAVLIKHGLKINMAMELSQDYPDKFAYEYYSMYPMIIKFELKQVQFN